MSYAEIKARVIMLVLRDINNQQSAAKLPLLGRTFNDHLLKWRVHCKRSGSGGYLTLV
jgi:hypothetical protein